MSYESSHLLPHMQSSTWVGSSQEVKLGVEGVDAADRAKVLTAKGSHGARLLYRVDLHLRDLVRKDLLWQPYITQNAELS